MPAQPKLDDLLICSWRSGILMPEGLPGIAAELLVEGADSPALRALAGIDLGPFDPRDVADLLEEVIQELAIGEPELVHRLEIASALLLHQFVIGDVRARLVTRHFANLAVAEGYPPEPTELLAFYALDDDWDSGVRSPDEVQRDVQARAVQLLERLELATWEPPRVIRDSLLKIA